MYLKLLENDEENHAVQVTLDISIGCQVINT